MQQGLSDNREVAEIRHLGLLFAIEMRQSCPDLVTRALRQGLLINVTAGKVIRLLPPLIIDSEQTAELARLLIACINNSDG